MKIDTGITKIKIKDEFVDIVAIFIILIVAYILYNIFVLAEKGKDVLTTTYKTLEAIPAATVKYVTDVDKDVSAAAARSEESFFAEQPLVVVGGTIASDIIGKVVGYDIVEEAAKQGAEYGTSLNECRGTLSVNDVSEYNKLTDLQRTAYNIWACNYNKTKAVNITTFHYAPSVTLWKESAGISSASIFNILQDYYGKSLFS